MAESPVQFFVPDMPKLARNLRGKLTAEYDKLKNQIVNADSWDEFNQRAGVIRGLEIALKLCIETEQDLYGKH